MQKRELATLMAFRSFLDRPRLYSLWDRVAEASLLDGCVVECGCGPGGSAGMIAGTLEAFHRKKRLIICDTFQGLPPLDPAIDIAPSLSAEQHGQMTGSAKGTQAMIRAACVSAGRLDEVECRPGLFCNTLPGWNAGPICFLHADADWYSSTTDILTHLYPHIVPGGIVVMDDFHFWAGCEKACLDYFVAHPTAPELHTVSCSVWWRK